MDHDILAETWDRLITGVQGYARSTATTNPLALQHRVAEANLLVKAGNPYRRIEALEAEITRLRTPSKDIRNANDLPSAVDAGGSGDAHATPRRRGRPPGRKSAA